MKKIIILTSFLFTANLLSAQETMPCEYLIVYINSGWNKEKKVTFYTIAADAGVPSATDLYNLKSVRELLPDENDPDYNKKKKERFTSINKDSIIYNYFESESLALNFIVSKKWGLFSAIPNVRTDYISNSTDSYGNTYSTAKYIFTRAE